MKTRYRMIPIALTTCAGLGLAAAQDAVEISPAIVASGGSASNGGYAITHCVGQPVVGEATEGEVTIAAGHLGNIVVVRSPEAPDLRVALDGSTVVLYWPAAEGDFRLERSADLANWTVAADGTSADGTTRIADGIIVEGPHFVVREPVDAARKFFRLVPAGP